MSDDIRTDNLVIPQGTTFSREYPITYPTGTTLVSAKAEIRTVYGAAGALLHSFTPVIDSVLGMITLQATPAESWAFGFATGVYNILATDSTGSVVEVARGCVTVAPGVTR